SYVAADPFFCLVHSSGRGPETTPQRVVETAPQQNDPFGQLNEQLGHYRTETIAGLPPFQGGAAGLFGYDLCHHVERLPRPRFDEFEVPDLVVGLYDWVIAFDHAAERCWLISTGFPETEPRRRRRRAEQRLAELQRRLRSPIPRRKSPSSQP